METNYSVTKNRVFSRLEQQMIWHKPESHQTSTEELRIASEIVMNWDDPEMKISNILLEGDAGSGKTQLAKALSYDLQLPYTKVTCFADMDKTDVFGALLPVIATDDTTDSELLEAIYQTDSLQAVIELIASHYGINDNAARERFYALVHRIEETEETEVVHYKFYPSEIVRAMENGYLLEIQEPTVIRDASVLVALNSALEPNGLLNIPTGLIKRHDDCVVVITTNRNYQGNRPLNESLRDRMQHAERMDLPALAVMVERAKAKTGVLYSDLLLITAKIIRLLDETSKANSIKGVAGMRSYFYWINTYKQQQNLLETIYSKVLYKLTTDENELKILVEALENSGLLTELTNLLNHVPLAEMKSKADGRRLSEEEAEKRNITELAEERLTLAPQETKPEESKSSETDNEAVDDKDMNGDKTEKKSDDLSADSTEDGESESEKGTINEDKERLTPGQIAEIYESDRKKRKEINKEARTKLKNTMHAKEGLIVHRPAFDLSDFQHAKMIERKVKPAVERLTKKINELLESDESESFSSGKFYGSRFNASRVALGDYRNFDKKNPPHDNPSLALAVRIDESGSMVRDNRIEIAKQAAIAISQFSEKVNIPLMIYGDTADQSIRERTSIFSYKEFDDSYDFVTSKLATMKPRQNNRDGVPLFLLAEGLTHQVATTKLLLNISDGLPKALPDYTGSVAREDIRHILGNYERQGIIVLSAAIGDDKEQIKDIYGENRFLDISDLETFPEQMMELIARFL